MPVDRGLEVCEFQTAQHWDLRNNQLRSTLGSRSDFVGVLLGSGIRGIIPISKSWLFLQRRSKMCGFGHGWFVADAEMSLGWMELGEWDRWIREGQMVGANESSAQCQLMTFFHFTGDYYCDCFPVSPFLWGDKSSVQQWRFSGGFIKSYKGQASVDNSSRWQCLSICFFFFWFFGTDKKRTRNKNVTIDLRLFSSKIFKDDIKMTINRELWTCQDIIEAWCSDTT